MFVVFFFLWRYRYYLTTLRINVMTCNLPFIFGRPIIYQGVVVVVIVWQLCLCNQCISPLKLLVRIPLMARCTRYHFMSDLQQVGGFSPGTPVSSTNKIDRHDRTEILIKVAINTIKPTNHIFTERHVFIMAVVPSGNRQQLLKPQLKAQTRDVQIKRNQQQKHLRQPRVTTRHHGQLLLYFRNFCAL